jgi:serine/threonine protein kinase/tetratricopeptide (TPR) repeat protein
LTDFRATLESKLGDTYIFERELGGGGMSRLFVALDRKLERRVVFKVLPEQLAGELNADRFRREIQLSARLQHPHIVPVLSSGEMEGVPFFVMPLIEGESLRQRIERTGELTIPDSVRFLREIASALAYAHKSGVVHRDIKPENILVSDDIAVVTDFGVAKAIEDSAVSSSHLHTTSGVILGTPAYMAPEQAAADPSIDHRADIYAFGILAYEMLTGSRPFTGRSAQALIAANALQPPEPIERRRPNIPEPLARLVMSCLEKRPADRPQTAQAVLQALADLDTGRRGSSSGERAFTIPTSDPKRPSRTRLVWGIPIAVLLIAGAGYLAVRAIRRPAVNDSGALTSVAVLPFVNVGGEANDEYFSEGMTDELANALNKLPGMRVASRTSSYALKNNRSLSVSEIGKRLNVQSVLEGSVRRAGGKLRVTAQLTSVADGLARWSDSYDRDANDVFAVQDDIARAITEALEPRLRGRPTAASIASTSRGTASLEAYDLYLRGRYFWNRRGADNLRRSVQYFEQAITKDPSFARSYAALAIAYALLPEYTDAAPPDVVQRARSAADHALASDSTLAEANTAVGLTAIHDWDWPTAEKRYRAALAQDPNYATAHQWFGEFFYHVGQVDSSIAQMRIAQRLDPLAPIIPSAVGGPLVLAHRYPDAIAELQKGIEMYPAVGLHHEWLAMAYLYNDNANDAVREMESGARLDPELAVRQGQLAYIYGKTGRRARAEAILAALEQRSKSEKVSPVALVYAHIGLGQTDAALAELERAVEAHDIALVSTGTILLDRIYDPLRSDPRFERILERMHLSQFQRL